MFIKQRAEGANHMRSRAILFTRIANVPSPNETLLLAWPFRYVHLCKRSIHWRKMSSLTMYALNLSLYLHITYCDFEVQSRCSVWLAQIPWSADQRGLFQPCQEVHTSRAPGHSLEHIIVALRRMPDSKELGLESSPATTHRVYVGFSERIHNLDDPCK